MDEFNKVVIPTFDNRRDNRQIMLQIGIVVFFLIAIGVLIGLYILGAPAQKDQRAITFRIEGTVGTARVTYTEPSGQQSDAQSVSVPWQPSANMYHSGMQVFLTAGSTSTSGTISCVMLLDGQEWKRESASDPEGKVACGGIVP